MVKSNEEMQDKIFSGTPYKPELVVQQRYMPMSAYNNLFSKPPINEPEQPLKLKTSALLDTLFSNQISHNIPNFDYKKRDLEEQLTIIYLDAQYLEQPLKIESHQGHLYEVLSSDKGNVVVAVLNFEKDVET